jgi:outer membrane protein assembly factor BamB
VILQTSHLRGWLAIASGLLLSIVLAGCAGPEKPKPAELAPNVALIGIRPAWSSTVGAIAFPMEMRVVGDQIFLASSSGMLAALDTRTGGDVWRVQLNSALAAGVGADGKFVAVVGRENELIVVDAGRELWRQKLGAVTLTSPLVAGARVFAVSADRTVVAFDAASGRKLWQQQRPADALVLGQPGVLFAFGDTLVVGLGGRLVGLNPQNGAVRWDAPIANSRGTNEVERLVDLVAGVSRDGDGACVRAFQTSVGCVNLVRGTAGWTKPANGSTGLAGNDNLVVGTEGDSKVIAWRRSDGERLWVSERLRFRGLSTPLLAGRSVIVGDDTGILHFLSREDGAPLNRMPTDGSAIVSAPILAGQTLIVATRRGGIFGFRPE